MVNVGERYGRLVVLSKHPGKRLVCQCDCGNIVNVSSDHIGKDTNSCGCLRREVSRAKSKTHGMARSRLHRLWCTIRERCNNPNGAEHESYHDRGIKVCTEWDDFTVFREWALKNGYDEAAKRGKCTIDRIDNDEGYSPENCRFITQKENSRNKRNTIWVTMNGERMSLPEACERAGAKYSLVRGRMAKGWELERAINTPPKKMSRRDA